MHSCNFSRGWWVGAFCTLWVWMSFGTFQSLHCMYTVFISFCERARFCMKVFYARDIIFPLSFFLSFLPSFLYSFLHSFLPSFINSLTHHQCRLHCGELIAVVFLLSCGCRALNWQNAPSAPRHTEPVRCVDLKTVSDTQVLRQQLNGTLFGGLAVQMRTIIIIMSSSSSSSGCSRSGDFPFPCPNFSCRGFEESSCCNYITNNNGKQMKNDDVDDDGEEEDGSYELF